ncbi:acyltransferase [Streptomyces tateyamensis]|uniref:Acyltransferase n=1 Tax=Streptomyces tateyamensis TaxID=565073 RepID=A0A2V4PPF3_9ACTN|nr:acyltransferase family protein [Streptomyces tateyamensis]PYC88230.1 acyltransferase [Streptomyces tateyamensis]
MRKPGQRGAEYRPDIEGLRAVAVLLVLGFHAAPRLLPGGFVGVDVFFVVSGFLITSLLVREAEGTGRISLAGFYARRARRILPAAALVLAVAGLLSYLFLPLTQLPTFGGDIAAAALDVVNWRLAARSVDYLAGDIGASPVQHFWSLAVEEQFYLLWPVLLVLARWGARRWRRPGTGVAAAVIALVAGGSLACSVVRTATSPTTAFFVTPTRLWEPALGALCALTLRRRRLGRFGPLLAGAGLALVLGSALLTAGQAAWPGYRALWPVLGAAAVLVGGTEEAGRLLAVRPLVWIGGLSYSLYLWHWPLLVAARAVRPEGGALLGAGVVLASVLPAWLSHRWVENPVRVSPALARRPGATWAVAAGCTALGVASGLVLTGTPPIGTPATAQATGQVIGASALDGLTAQQQAALWRVDAYPAVRPDPLHAGLDVPAAYGRGCQAGTEASAVASCDFGDPAGGTLIVLAGDSKILQWEPALDLIGRQHAIHVVTMTKSNCAFTDAVPVLADHPYASCVAWNRQVTARILALKPALVLTSQNSALALDSAAAAGPGTAPPMRAGLARTWTRLQQAGIPVVAVLNNTTVVPAPVDECVARHPAALSTCAFRPDYRTADLQAEVARQLGAGVIDLNARICPEQHCPAVIGSVLVYRDGTHLTATYVDTLAPALAARLAQQFAAHRIGWAGPVGARQE